MRGWNGEARPAQHWRADGTSPETPTSERRGSRDSCDDKGYFDEDDGTTLDPVQVRAGVEREMAFMGELGVGEAVRPSEDGKGVVNTMVLPTER